MIFESIIKIKTHLLFGKSAKSSDGDNGKREAKERKVEKLNELCYFIREIFSTELSLKVKTISVQDQTATHTIRSN